MMPVEGEAVFLPPYADDHKLNYSGLSDDMGGLCIVVVAPETDGVVEHTRVIFWVT